MAYKTFANGFPLPASDLNNFLMNQSVIVFADSAARTTAIPSPVEGMLTYLEDTNAYESWNGSAYVGLGSPITTEGDLITGDASGVASRIAIGTADQVLTVASGVPTWADATGGAGAWTQIHQGTIPTGGATSTISGLSGYSNYLIIYSDVDVSILNSDLTLLINGDGSGHVASSRISGTGNTGSETTTNFPIAKLSTAAGGGAAMNKSIIIRNANSTSVADISFLGGSTRSNGSDRSYLGFGIINKDDLALASIGIESSVGTFSNGSIRVFGA
jgi:hypothetical protein